MRGDVTKDGRITPGDAQAVFDLYVQIVLGEVEPPSPLTVGSDLWAADFNKDGRITPGDAQAIFDLYIELTSGKRLSAKRLPRSIDPMFAASIEVGEVKGARGEIVSVPLHITQGVGIRAFALDLLYNPNELEYTGIDRTGTTTETFNSVIGISLPGKVNVAGFAGPAEAITGDTVFINVLFKIVSDDPGVFTIVPGTFLDDISTATPISGGILLDELLAELLKVETVTGRVGSTIVVPILVQDVADVKAFAFDIDADFSLIQFVETSSEGTLTEHFASMAAIPNMDGGLTVAGYAGVGEPAEGSGVFVNLKFEIVQSGADGTISIRLKNLIDDLETLESVAGAIQIDTTPVEFWMLH